MRDVGAVLAFLGLGFVIGSALRGGLNAPLAVVATLLFVFGTALVFRGRS